jgi:hypothetical protein
MLSIPLLTIGNAIYRMFQIITNVRTMNNAIFWRRAPCSLYVNRRFGGTYRLDLQGRKSAKQETSLHLVARQNLFIFFSVSFHYMHASFRRKVDGLNLMTLVSMFWLWRPHKTQRVITITALNNQP